MVNDKRIDNYVAPDSLLFYMYGDSNEQFFLSREHTPPALTPVMG